MLLAIFRCVIRIVSTLPINNSKYTIKYIILVQKEYIYNTKKTFSSIDFYFSAAFVSERRSVVIGQKKERSASELISRIGVKRPDPIKSKCMIDPATFVVDTLAMDILGKSLRGQSKQKYLKKSRFSPIFTSRLPFQEISPNQVNSFQYSLMLRYLTNCDCKSEIRWFVEIITCWMLMCTVLLCGLYICETVNCTNVRLECFIMTIIMFVFPFLYSLLFNFDTQYDDWWCNPLLMVFGNSLLLCK